jgi:hypothetical protein
MRSGQWLIGGGTVGVLACLLASAASGQAPVGQPLPGVPTTVQLPTFSVFSVQTTVSVPDRGGMYLGGLNYGADGRSVRGFGPLGSRGIGSGRVASGVSVGATIIDNAELDRAVLAEAARRRGASPATSDGKAAEIAATIAPSRGPIESVAALRARSAAKADERADQRAAEVAQWLAKARQAEADGKPAVARVFYQMVARQKDSPLKPQAEARLAALGLGRR